MGERGGGGQDWGGELASAACKFFKMSFFSWSLIVPLYAVICLSSSCTLADMVQEFKWARYSIDLFKVYAAILQGVQNYWGKRAAELKMQMADCDQ